MLAFYLAVNSRTTVKYFVALRTSVISPRYGYSLSCAANPLSQRNRGEKGQVCHLQ
jgi:hypothetical protein